MHVDDPQVAPVGAVMMGFAVGGVAAQRTER
jgi:hypothetical protein